MTKKITQWVGSAALGFVVTATAIAGMQIHAQSIAKHNSRAPVDFEADRIELQDKQKRVILSGNVDITQAGLNLRSARTLIDYKDQGTFEIQRITATGGVSVTRGNESARGQVAVYDFNRRIITMAGNVTLRRGSDQISGGRVTIDLASGLSSIDGSSSGSSSVSGGNDNVTIGNSGGRVKGRFTVPQR